MTKSKDVITQIKKATRRKFAADEKSVSFWRVSGANNPSQKSVEGKA
jgi:hypothetical protein